MTRLYCAPFASILAAVALAGCATDGVKPSEPRVVIQRVEVPIPTPCVVKAVPVPDFADAANKLEAAANLFEKVKLLLAGRIQHYAYEGELRAAQKACGA